MVIKCPNCDGALEYDITSGLLVCKFCKASFTAEEIGSPETDPADEEAVADHTMPVWTSSTADASNSQSAVYKEEGTEGKEPAYVFDISEEERSRRRSEYYAQQARLSEEYNQRKKIDYTKPFAGMAASAAAASTMPSDIDLSDGFSAEERQKKVNDYYANQARLHEEYANRPQVDYSKPFAGTSRENMTMEEIEVANREDEIALNNKLKEIDNQYNNINPYGRYSNTGKTRTVNSPYLPFVASGQNNYNSLKKNNPRERAREIFAQKREDGYFYASNGARIIQNASGAYVTTDAPPDVGADTMDNKIYTCTTCGAELALTGVETSSFCAYCGQPTIVFDRMETCTKPDCIIPFTITRDTALKLIRDRLNKGALIPNEVKNFQVEKICGIYIPYWLFDASYTDSMVIKTRVKQGKSTTTKYYRVNSNCNLFYFPVDASKRLNDNTSRKLDPYDYSGIRPFNISYMSGFYSDRFDMGSDTMTMMAMSRAQNLMYEKAKKKVPGSPQGMVDTAPVFHVRKKYYTMLPAWFMSFRYEFKTYTIMVNGQTGKVVGAVPYEKKKFIALFAGLVALLSLATVPLSIFLTKSMLTSKSSNSMKMLAIPIVFGIIMLIAASAKMNKYKKNMELTTEDEITRFVKERQEVE